MNITIHFPATEINGSVTLPASKSISNRVLLINALAESEAPVENLADCDDTNSMLKVLCSNDYRFDIGHAGTAMRFLTAYLSRIAGTWEITGSERMQQRPVSILVDALNRLGARIEYTGREGYPPLRIRGSYLPGGEIDMPASVSSQYISALMMIAPYMADGLKINLSGKIVSETYIRMTLSIMHKFGADARFTGNVITIAPQPYRPIPYRVESDWSGASYFFELLAIAGSGEIRLSGLHNDSMQGDAGQLILWQQLGVATRFEGETLRLTKQRTEIARLEYDFVEMPDLVQSFAVACCTTGIPFAFTGIETLRIKETDRIAALINELAKLGYRLEATGNDLLTWDGSRIPPSSTPIATYHDHRMAMAFAPAALKHGTMTIEDPDVVSKSFPAYWEQLEKLGMNIK